MKIEEIAIFVDGKSEKLSLESHFKKYYGKSPKLVSGPGNGIKYSAELYAKRIAGDVVTVLNSSSHTVILVPDLEKREAKQNINCSKFGEQIKSAVIREIISIAKVQFKEEYLQEVIYVCPSDIMFENWIVCDIKGTEQSKLYNRTLAQSCFDGQNGANIIGKLMHPNKYKKVVHAYMLFKNVDPNIGISNSPSFECFISTIRSLIEPQNSQ